ncbi:hypothetical protein [[Clostridium] fimetarium]|uniref:Uncharacterized protein n=1 Tax=[Clostridium] fimetarium TaxID=99656 RepID=A0A1I0QVI5_9FIRM|nr:hypothetical protein [[Clostridium] fimetarium]SEW31653.1 hypothetical protein SAMN05421659_109169 [[Clostridium] fimetarium]
MTEEKTLELLNNQLEETISTFWERDINNKRTFEDDLNDINICELAQCLSKLGFTFKINSFIPENRLYYFQNEVFLEVGTQKVYLTKVKTYRFLIDEIILKVKEETVKADCETKYIYDLASFRNKPITQIYINSYEEGQDIQNIIRYISMYRKADEDFIKLLGQLGYTVKYKEYYDAGSHPYISLTNCPNTDTIWLVECNKQHTLYRSFDRRNKLEILYLLISLQYQENIFADEL